MGFERLQSMMSGVLAGQHAAPWGSGRPLQQARPVCSTRRAISDQASTSGRSDSESYTYNSGSPTERRKATIEHIYQEKGGGRTGPPSPWNMGWQMNERNLVWNDDLKARLLKVSMQSPPQNKGPRFQLPTAGDLRSSQFHRLQCPRSPSSSNVWCR